MQSKVFLSVVVPAFNEAVNFSGKLSQITEYLNKQKYHWEIVVVNDGSSDNTLELLNEFSQSNKGVRVVDSLHQGKAGSIIRGVRESVGDYIIFSDMDQATPISESARILTLLQSGYDIVIGSRSKREGAPVVRQILAYGMVILRTLLLRLPYRDTQCGFKGFSRKAAQRIFPVLEKIHPPHEIHGPAVNPGFDVELLYLGRKLGFRIAQTPVTWHHIKSDRVRFFKDAVSGVTELLLVRWRSVTNAYQL
jgi:glycosyltransferase involved in cell wall biosynthesis